VCFVFSSDSTVGRGQAAVAGLFARPELGGDRREVTAGTVIHEQHEPAENVYFIHRGQVRIYQMSQNDGARLVEILGPGQWFGAAALSDDRKFESRAIAVTSATISQVPAERIRTLVTQTPDAAMELIRQLANRLQSERDAAARLVFDDCNQRLVKTMLRFSNSCAATQQGDAIELHITHDQLAQAVGVARETVSLALTEMRHQNVVRTGRNRVIFNLEALKQFAENAKTQVA
jgi:CRP/FNR family transcriptional regulator